MTRGRRQKPVALDKLHGNPGKRGKKKPTFTASKTKFGLPRGLNKEVRKKCREMALFLQQRGAPVEYLRSVFERYCKHLNFAHEAAQAMKKDGVVTTGAMGGLVKHPACQVFKDNSAAALKIEEYFEKIVKNTEPPEKEDPVAAFLKKGGKPYPVK